MTRRRVIYASIGLFFAITVIVPIISMLSRITRDGLISVFTSSQFKSATINSAYTALIATVISLTIALIAAWCLERTAIKFKEVFAIVFVVPMLIPSISHAFGLVALFGANGLVTNFLNI